MMMMWKGETLMWMRLTIKRVYLISGDVCIFLWDIIDDHTTIISCIVKEKRFKSKMLLDSRRYDNEAKSHVVAAPQATE